MYCIYLNGHLYICNHSIKKLEQLREPDEKVIVDSYYYISNSTTKQVFIESINDLHV